MKAKVSRFFATVGAAILIVACFVVCIPHAFLGFGALAWLTVGVASFSVSFAIDHWPSRSAS